MKYNKIIFSEAGIQWLRDIIQECEKEYSDSDCCYVCPICGGRYQKEISSGFEAVHHDDCPGEKAKELLKTITGD